MKTIEVAQRLRVWSESKYGSVGEFASALGVSIAQGSHYLNGYRIPGNKIQQKLRDLGCDIDWLMTGKTKVEYKIQKENAELLKLKEENEMLRSERDALLRSLSPEIAGVILSGIKVKRKKK